MPVGTYLYLHAVGAGDPVALALSGILFASGACDPPVSFLVKAYSGPAEFLERHLTTSVLALLYDVT
jgi:hypothetical protein